jgi:predicted RNA-binding protein YlqC (UPF0109 family)
MNTSSIDQQFVEFVVKSLVSKPEAVQVERRIDEKGVLLELTVDPEDLGRVIGKRGATAQSLRTLLRALGTKNDARYNLKIVDNGEPRPERHYDDTPRDTAAASTAAGPAATDDTASDDLAAATEEPADIPEVDDSDRISKTRKELEELDDLDV